MYRNLHEGRGVMVTYVALSIIRYLQIQYAMNCNFRDLGSNPNVLPNINIKSKKNENSKSN